MTSELKSEWVKALRSGEYKQGFGMLRDNGGGHCCLGVLGDLLVKRGAAMWGRDNYLDYEFDRAFTVLPARLRADLKVFDPLMDRLVAMNDKGRNTFPEIADWIETNIEAEETPVV